MRGMILAAGRGARMGALTADCPKPLLKANGKYLIEYSIAALINSGIRDIMINISYCGAQIKAALGDGARYGVNFYYSEESEALETGGGILQVLPFFLGKPFIVLSSDVVTDYLLQKLPIEPTGLAHLVLVDNPGFHPRGDFCLQGERVSRAEQNQFTFSNIGVYRPELFAECAPGKFRLGDLLKKAVDNAQVTGEYYQGLWHNLGTPSDLQRFSVIASGE
jgi:MurNAc alpha-1-phosphate uridylyltransferase